MKRHNTSNQVSKSKITGESYTSENSDEVFTHGKMFCVDHSKNGRAKCRKCRKNIDKDMIRIGKNVIFKDQYILHYFHVECIFDSFKRARSLSNVITSLSEIAVLEDISDEDRSMLTSLIEGVDVQRLIDKKSDKRAEKINKGPLKKVDQKKLKSHNKPITKFLFTNGDQMNSAKFQELQQHVDREKPLIIAICEVKPKNCTKERTNEDYQIPDYELHPVNLQNNDAGRGIAVYTHNSISKSVTQIKLDIEYEEACLLEVRLRGGDKLLFACCYRSPTTSSTSEMNNDNLNLLLNKICDKNYSHRCIIGDFNFKDINWTSWTTPHGAESKEAKFIEAIKDCFLHQHIDEPTRRRGNDIPSQLDLIFSDEEMQVTDIQHLAPLGKSDHSVISFNYCSYIDYSKPKDVFDLAKGDYEAMRTELLESNWCAEFVAGAKSRSCEENWRLLKAKIIELKNKYVPIRKAPDKPQWKKGVVPISQEAKAAILNKRKSHRRWMSKRHADDSAEARKSYTKASNKVKKLLRKAKKAFEKGIAVEAKANPKKFWLHARKKLSTKTGIAPLLENSSDPDSLRFDDEAKANILQKQFLSVFTTESTEEIPKLSQRTTSIIRNLIIIEDDVQKRLSSLNPNKSCGPDGIPSRILKELAEIIAGPITALFNCSLQRGEVPSDWKKANISPIFKKGSKSIAANYRPISLTAVLCKLMESFIRDHVMTYLMENILLTVKQHGFICGRSTVTQLLKYLDDCAKCVASGKVVDAIYLDFEKAFDTVPHRRLLEKLKAYGITGEILSWIGDYLRERTQVVLVNGTDSAIGAVSSGVPQGSVLGPLLFVIYINDMLDNITSGGLLFADDTKVYRQICSKEDSLKLQSDIDLMKAWTDRWLLRFNADKCHVLTLGRIENILHTHRYKINDKELEHVFEEKDLGVHVDADLSFEEHIATKIKKANQIMGLIRRTFTYLDKESFKKLYTALVRPHLEYAQAVWSPHLKKYQDLVERVQMRATKLVDHMGALDYSERLKAMKLPTLSFRRYRGDMIEVFKHFHKYDRSIISESFQPRERPSRKHNFQLHEKKPIDGVRGVHYNSFYNRTARQWNDLPSHVVDATSVDMFKNRFDEANKDNLQMFDYEATTTSSDL